MKKIFIIFLFFVASYSVFSVTLFGKVYNESNLEPIIGAKIETHGIKTQSDSKGYYYFNNFDYGMLIIEVRASGYIPFTTTISLDDKKFRYDIPMKPIITPQTPNKVNSPRKEPILSIPKVERPKSPIVAPVKRAKSPTKKGTSTSNIAFPENLDKKETPPVVDNKQKSYSIEFIHAKKMLENGDFIDALPLFYSVSQFGESQLSMQSDYYISIIYRAQKLYLLEIDFLFKAMSKAYETGEKESFVNQIRADLATAYFKSGHSATAKILTQKILDNTKVNFPITNFNSMVLMAEMKKNDGKFEEAFKYYENALKIKVKPELKNSVYLKVIDFHIQREEFSKAKHLLTELSDNFQSSQTEKRKILLSALEMYQSELRSGNTTNISKKVIPEIEKCINIDPDFTIALSYMANIEFLIGKLENNLQMIMDAKRKAEHLKSISPDFRDQSGKTTDELVGEISAFLKNY